MKWQLRHHGFGNIISSRLTGKSRLILNKRVLRSTFLLHQYTLEAKKEYNHLSIITPHRSPHESGCSASMTVSLPLLRSSGVHHPLINILRIAHPCAFPVRKSSNATTALLIFWLHSLNSVKDFTEDEFAFSFASYPRVLD